MKWYESIKVKLIGFFVVVSLSFLIFIVASFSLFRESELKKNAVEKARLSTIHVIDKISHTKIKMEEDVRILANAAARDYADKKLDASVILTLINAMGDAHVPSGGVWFEPYVLNPSKKDGVIFFNRDASKNFIPVENYLSDKPESYRDMEFYVLGKALQKGETFWTKVYTDPVTHVRMITVVAPIYQNNTFLGVASLDMEVNHYMEHSQAFSNGYMMILDRQGTFITKSMRIKKYIGAYIAILGRVDAVVFSGGIGEHSPIVREKVCSGLEYLGLVLDTAKNRKFTHGALMIHHPKSRVAIVVAQTNEAMQMARESAELLKARKNGDQS